MVTINKSRQYQKFCVSGAINLFLPDVEPFSTSEKLETGSEGDDHAKPVLRKNAAHRLQSVHTAWVTQNGASLESHLERGHSELKEIHPPARPVG